VTASRAALLFPAGGGDPQIANVIYLSNFENLSGSNDVSIIGANMGYGGSAAQSNTQAKFGSFSAHFNAGTDRLSGTLSSGLGAGDFAVEFWFFVTAIGADQAFWAMGASSSESGRIQTGALADGSMYYYNASALRITTAANIFTLNVWNFCQLLRTSGVVQLGLNGVQVGSNFSDSANYSSADQYIGHSNYPGAGNATVGYIDEMRVTKAARSFNLPTAAFPTS